MRRGSAGDDSIFNGHCINNVISIGNDGDRVDNVAGANLITTFKGGTTCINNVINIGSTS